MPLNTMLPTSFRFLSDSHDHVLSTEEFNRHCDLFHDALVQLHPSFPCYGQVSLSTGAILDLLTSEIK
jgi:hypothetical protein